MGGGRGGLYGERGLGRPGGAGGGGGEYRGGYRVGFLLASGSDNMGLAETQKTYDLSFTMSGNQPSSRPGGGGGAAIAASAAGGRYRGCCSSSWWKLVPEGGGGNGGPSCGVLIRLGSWLEGFGGGGGGVRESKAGEGCWMG